ncbi:MAG: hypothetical protein ACT4PL_00365 [Phycisphaerales bacterium]
MTDEVTEHNGDPLPAEAVFFAPAPPEIGAVLTAHTSLRKGQRPWNPGTRWLVCIVPGALVAAGFVFLGWRNNPGTTAPINPEDVVGLIFGGIVFAIAWALTGFSHSCSYVGSLGIARLAVRGGPDRPPRIRRLLFEEVAELRTFKNSVYVNFIYAGTNYWYKWADARGKVRFKIAGGYWTLKENPGVADPSWIGESASRAWTQFLWPRMAEEIDRVGWMQFNIAGGRFVRVGRGYVEYGKGDRTARIDREDIKSVKIESGVVTIEHKDARWYSGKGKFTCAVQQLANFRVFLIAVEMELGYMFE